MNQAQSNFTWNLGGLIGSAFGIGVWIALTPLFANWPTTGVIVGLGCPLFLIMAVYRVWSMREKWSALKGMNVFLVCAFGISCHFLLYAHFNELPIVMSWPPTRLTSASNGFLLLLIFPALAALFFLSSQSRNTKRQNQN